MTKTILITSILVLILFISGCAETGYTIQEEPEELEEEIPEEIPEPEPELEPEPEETDMFSHNIKLHWDHMPLTYRFSTVIETYCSDKRKGYINKAFELITNSTNGTVSFVEGSNEDIFIYCYGTEKASPGMWNEELQMYVPIYAESDYDENEKIISNAVIKYYLEDKYSYADLIFKVEPILFTFGYTNENDLTTCIEYADDDSDKACTEMEINDNILNELVWMYTLR